MINPQILEDNFNGHHSIYNYEKFIKATGQFPKFCREGSQSDHRREAAAFLANISHETGNLRKVNEDITQDIYCNPNYPQYSCVQGKKYHGRGAIQLSWNYNYGSFGEYLHKERLFLFKNGEPVPQDYFLKKPESIAESGYLAFLSAVWFWMTPQGKDQLKCHEAIIKNGFGKTIEIINGFEECRGKNPQQVNSRVRLYKIFCQQLKVDPGRNLEC